MQDRDHLQFVCKLKDYVPDQQKLLSSIPAALEQAGMTVQEASIEEAEEALQRDYFKNTKLVDLASGVQLTADVHPSSGNIAPGKQRALHPFGSQIIEPVPAFALALPGSGSCLCFSNTSLGHAALINHCAS